MDNARKQPAGKEPLRTTRLAGIQREHRAYFAGWAAIFTWLYTAFMPKAAWTPRAGSRSLRPSCCWGSVPWWCS